MKIAASKYLTTFTAVLIKAFNPNNWLHLCRSMHETTRKRGADPSNSRRSMSREYHLVKKGEKIRVCQKMFLNTFAIDEKRIRTLLNNKSEAGTPIPDGRGRHSNHYHVEKRTGYVMEHIKASRLLSHTMCDVMPNLNIYLQI